MSGKKHAETHNHISHVGIYKRATLMLMNWRNLKLSLCGSCKMIIILETHNHISHVGV